MKPQMGVTNLQVVSWRSSIGGTMMYCSKCGATIPSAGSICSKCSAPSHVAAFGCQDVLDVTLDDEYPELDIRQDQPAGGNSGKWPQVSPSNVGYPPAPAPLAYPPDPAPPAYSAQPYNVAGPHMQQAQPIWPWVMVLGGPVGCALAPFLLLAGLGISLFACYFAPLVAAGVIALFIWFRIPAKPAVRSRYIWTTLAAGAVLTVVWIAVIAIIGSTGATENSVPPS